MPEQNPEPRLTVNSKTFALVETTRLRVHEMRQELDDASAAKSRAQNEYNESRDEHQKAIDRLISELRGAPELPLFANMTEAIESATNNPVVDRLFTRLVDHGVSHLNILIIVGWLDTERAEVIAWLDSLDARKDLADAGVAEDQLPPTLPMPAFLEPPLQTDALGEVPPPMGPTDEDLVAALKEADIELTTQQISVMTTPQRFEAMTWAYRVKHVKTEKGDAVVFDDLPPAPPFISDPSVLNLRDQLKANDVKKPGAAKKPKKGKGKRKGKK